MFLKKVSYSSVEPSRASSLPPVGVQSQHFCVLAVFEFLCSDSIPTSHVAESICVSLGIVGLFLDQENGCFHLYFLCFYVQCNIESASTKAEG